MKRRALVTYAVCLGAFGAAAPVASADIQYGGTGFNKSRAGGPSTSLVRHDDGRISVRLASGYTCGKSSYVSRIVKLSGTTADGVSFTATGTTRLSGKGQVRYTLTGTLAPDAVTGTLVEGRSGCPKYTLGVALRTESALAGAPAAPPRGVLFNGLTGQSAGGIRLPVALKVTTTGRIYGNWQALMRCGPKAKIPMGNVTPTTSVKSDGTFSRSETFTVRYTDGSSERYRVNFSGRFLADGVVGTLRARMQIRKKGKSYYPCDSKTQNWTARA